MNLEQAIQHAREQGAGDDPCAADHRQLADWLQELIVRRDPANITFTHEEAQRLRETIMGDEHGGNRAACRAVFAKLDAFVVAKWDVEEAEGS